MTDAPLDLSPKISGCGHGKGEWALTQWPVFGGEIRWYKCPYYPLLIGVSHKYSAVFTKQAARVTSCVCVSQILLMSGLNQPWPIPRPLTSIRTLAEVEKTPTHIFSSPPTSPFNCSHTFPLPSRWILSLSPSLSVPPSFFPSSLNRELRRRRWAWGACVYECVSHVQAHPGPTAAHRQGETQAGIGCPHLLVGLAAALLWFT